MGSRNHIITMIKTVHTLIAMCGTKPQKIKFQKFGSQNLQLQVSIYKAECYEKTNTNSFFSYNVK